MQGNVHRRAERSRTEERVCVQTSIGQRRMVNGARPAPRTRTAGAQSVPPPIFHFSFVSPALGLGFRTGAPIVGAHPQYPHPLPDAVCARIRPRHCIRACAETRIRVRTRVVVVVLGSQTLGLIAMDRIENSTGTECAQVEGGRGERLMARIQHEERPSPRWEDAVGRRKITGDAVMVRRRGVVRWSGGKARPIRCRQ
jgi:hypothetical protein